MNHDNLNYSQFLIHCHGISNRLVDDTFRLDIHCRGSRARRQLWLK